KAARLTKDGAVPQTPAIVTSDSRQNLHVFQAQSLRSTRGVNGTPVLSPCQTLPFKTGRDVSSASCLLPPGAHPLNADVRRRAEPVRELRGVMLDVAGVDQLMFQLRHLF